MNWIIYSYSFTGPLHGKKTPGHETEWTSTSARNFRAFWVILDIIWSYWSRAYLQQTLILWCSTMMTKHGPWTQLWYPSFQCIFTHSSTTEYTFNNLQSAYIWDISLRFQLQIFGEMTQYSAAPCWINVKLWNFD